MAKRILVVEDDQDILYLIEFLLTQEGYEVITSLTGLGIVEQIENEHPDLILLDIMLPGIDGRDICRDIKRNAKTKEIPVVMMSAHVDISRTIRDVGADDFIAKPFDIYNLLGRIERQLIA
ncbi:response regulator transcription factor [Rubrolithibacter danxiaensis]|uniref:response regulator transcription factor n=1 Tax=Rubrolithibacter danxiaensis TaxID=3390805 RepID=UPI003BF857F2